jgi:hypothetical protein
LIQAVRGDGVKFGDLKRDAGDDIRQGASDIEELLDLKETL